MDLSRAPHHLPGSRRGRIGRSMGVAVRRPHRDQTSLLRSKPSTVSVTHEQCRITWTIRPVIFLPLAHRQSAELPVCAYDFKDQAPQASD